MFVDYIPVMLINMAGGLGVLALYILFGANKVDGKSWAPAFAIPGAVALITGVHMTLTWPIPDLSRIDAGMPNLQFANVAFGEMTILFGVLFLAAAIGLTKGWSLLPVSVYALAAGGIAVIVGARLWHLGLTNAPVLTGVGFVLTGLCGVMAGPFLWVRRFLIARLVAAAVIAAATVIWACTAIQSYWAHLLRFSTAVK